jgi:hypothetical protein
MADAPRVYIDSCPIIDLVKVKSADAAPRSQG